MTIGTFYKDGIHLVPSNFWAGEKFTAPAYGFEGEGVLDWISNEHYYQAAKGASFKDVIIIQQSKTPGQAKRLGRKVKMRPDWEAVKIPVMRKGLGYKFAPGTYCANWLLDSGNQILIEGNTWGDRFWGVDGYGENWLGWCLMAQRDYLKCVVPEQGTFL